MNVTGSTELVVITIVSYLGWLYTIQRLLWKTVYSALKVDYQWV